MSLNSHFKATLNHPNELFIKFSPQRNQHFKNVNVTVLVGQLEYWFEKYTTGFFKFMEPCHHNLYKHGDSWTEELSFSRKMFNKAFDKIGKRYKSRAAFDTVEDKFQGKLYASYYDRDSHKTYYFKNHQLKDYCKSDTPEASNNLEDDQNKEEQNNGPFYNGTLGRSPIYKDTKNTSWNYNPPKSPLRHQTQALEKKIREREAEDLILKKGEKKKEKEEKSLSQPLTPASPLATPQKVKEFDPQEVQTLQFMHDIWLKHMGKYVKTPALNFKTLHTHNLLQALKTFFSNCLERWERYCRRIASSKFLTGQVKSFVIWLAKAITAQVIEKVKCGDYGVDTTIDLPPPGEKRSLEKDQLEASRLQALETIEQSDQEVWEKKLRVGLIETYGLPVYRSWYEEVKFSLERVELMKSSALKSLQGPWEVEEVTQLRLGTPLNFAVPQLQRQFKEFFESCLRPSGIDTFEVYHQAKRG